MPCWIDTHCHLDATEFDADRPQIVERARAAGVSSIVLPAVDLRSCAAVRSLAHEHGFAYALGIHPLYVASSADPKAHEKTPGRSQVFSSLSERVLKDLHELLSLWSTDPRCVAVGEIGLDDFAPPPGGTGKPSAHHAAYWQQQIQFLVEQLKLARAFDLPVVLHMRRCADELTKHLRRAGVRGGIVHAFNGSYEQASALIDLGFKLGFGGAMTFERALQIRRLAQALPLEAIVLETDAPDMPPHWLYRTAADRKQGQQQTCRNEPAELPRIAQTLADLRGLDLNSVAELTRQNALAALPKLEWLFRE
jgi:TatD DNase family protein